MASRPSGKMLKSLPPDPARHQDSAITIEEQPPILLAIRRPPVRLIRQSRGELFRWCPNLIFCKEKPLTILPSIAPAGLSWINANPDDYTGAIEVARKRRLIEITAGFQPWLPCRRPTTTGATAQTCRIAATDWDG